MSEINTVIKKLYIAAALEKLSFNGLGAMLVLYMAQHIMFTDSRAFDIYGVAAALAFVSSLIGGWLSDSFIGYKKTLIVGSTLMMLGSVLLINFSVQTDRLYLALAFISLGSGFIRGNIPAILGLLCCNNKLNQDLIFSRFYVAINIGSLLGAICCGVLGQIFGWNLSFIIAAVAMLGFLLITSNRKLTIPVDVNRSGGRFFDLTLIKYVSIIAVTVACCLIFSLLIKHSYLMGYLLCFLMAICVIMMIGVAIKHNMYRPIFIILSFMLFNIVFFALYNQENMSIIMFAERGIDRSINSLLGINQINFFHIHIKDIPATIFQSIDPLWNIFLGVILARLWIKISNSKNELGFAIKFIFGAILTACAFLLLYFGIYFAGNEKVAIGWLFFSYMFFVLGELLIIPIGLSLVSILSPKQFSGMFMGIWYFSMGFAIWIAVIFSQMSSLKGDSSNLYNALQVYRHAFHDYILWSLLLCLYMLLVLFALYGKKILNSLREGSYAQKNEF